jgi:HAMP domain-containing protein
VPEQGRRLSIKLAMTTHSRSTSTPLPTPPVRGASLGLRLGIVTTLVVTGTMAILSGAQLFVDLRGEVHDQQRRFSDSLAPLVAELHAAPTRTAVEAALHRFHAAYFEQGQAEHQLAVVDAADRPVLATGATGAWRSPNLLTATVRLVIPALGPDAYALWATTDNSDFVAARKQRWKAWAVHVGVTALLILAMLFVVIRREVTGPIDRLLEGVRKMEMGYWEDLPDPGGAWEVRWLGWRFRTLGEELSRTVEHLVAAQRRAYATDLDPDRASQAIPGEASLFRDSLDHPDAIATVLQLQARLERLQRARPDDPGCLTLAQSTWDQYAAQAERLGQPELRASLEDAALRVLDPNAFADISVRIEAERPRLEKLARARGDQIRRALVARSVPVVEIRHRVKHPAGIWKKMRQKNLTFDQVHDLVALRIVVPTETDCYRALGEVHDLYAPIVGRFKDYVVRPKSNGYRSLHASVRDAERAVFEVQIRSIAMHRHAEQGPAAHADYKGATQFTADSGRGAPWQRLFQVVRRLRQRRQP